MSDFRTHKKVQQAVSMSVIDQNTRRNHHQVQQPTRQPVFEKRGRSFSHSSVHDQPLSDSSYQYHGTFNNGSLSKVSSSTDYVNGTREENSGSHINSIIEEVPVYDDRPDLNSKIKELEAQLASLRITMEQNERSILQVQEERRQEWEKDVTRLKKELDDQVEFASEMEDTLQQQLLRLEQDNLRLRTKIEQLKEETCNIKNSSAHQNGHSKPDENANVLFGNGNKRSRKALEEKSNEISSLKEKVQLSQRQLQQEKEKVEKLEQDLEIAKQNKRQQTPDLVKKQSSSRDEDCAKLKANLSQLGEVKTNLTKQISLQEDELQVLQRRLMSRDKELAQERSEVAYLRDVQEKLQAKLEQSEKELKEFKMRNPSITKVPELECKLRNKERDLERALEDLKQMEIEKNTEVVQLQKQILRKESEVLQLQSQVGDMTSDLKNNGKNKQRRSFKDLMDTKATQKQMEQDYMTMQVKLTKREQELFQMKRELAAMKESTREERDGLQRKWGGVESDLKVCKEKIQLKEEELGLLQEKFQEREKEIASLYDKLERLNPNINGVRFTDEGQGERDRQAEIRELRDENAYFREKLNRVTIGVKVLSSSQMNLAAKPSGSSDSDDVIRLQNELYEMEAMIQRKIAEFEEERIVWQTEKVQVLSYQKQLQLNYMQMGQKNRKLEREIQQLTTELDREDVIHC